MRRYEDLAGSTGRKVFYRAERFAASDLFPRGRAEVDIEDETLALKDLSMTGLGARTAGAAIWATKIGTVVPVRMRLGKSILHEGMAQIRRADRDGHGVTLGLGLSSGFIDVAALLGRSRTAQLQQEIAESLSDDTDAVDPAYRQFAADTLNALRRYRFALERLEKPENGRPAPSRAILDEALALCEERAVPEWREMWWRGNALVAPIMDDPLRLAATKQLTERILTPECIAAPIVRRSYEKPLGYPGDFEVMNQIYSWRREGESTYGRLLHRLGLETGECIAARMSMMQRSIARLIGSSPATDDEYRVASIGSGPAQEIVNYLSIGALPRRASFTLVDQEEQALDYAYRRILPQTIRHGGRSKVSCLHMSLVDLSRRTSTFGGLPDQDLVYSLGLLDYFSANRARQLVHNLFQHVTPGGVLVIGNMRRSPQSCLWPMEFVSDWRVHYRDEAEMMALAEGLPVTSVRLEADSTGRVYLLFLQKA